MTTSALLTVICIACGSSRSLDEIAAAARARTSGPGGTTSPTGGGPTVSGGDLGPQVEGATSSATVTGGGAGATGAGDPASGADGHFGVGGPGAALGPAAGAPIRLGNVGDYAGIVGAGVGQVPLTLQVWARWLNDRGGINGRPVEIVSANTGGDPARQAALVRDLVENQGVVAFISNMDLLSGGGGLAYLEQRQVPVIGGDGVAERWNQSPVLFPVTTGLRALLTAIARVGPLAGKPNVAILYCAEADFICGVAKRELTDNGGAARVGAKVVYTAQVTLAQPSFTSECLQAQRAGAQTIVAFVDAGSINRLSRDCRQQGFTPLIATGSLSVSPALEGNPDVVGLRAPVTTFPWMATDVPAGAEYHDALRTYAPGVAPSPDGSIAWTAGALFMRVATAAGPDISPASLLAALGTIHGDTLGGASGPLTFTPGQPTPESRCYFVLEMSPALKWAAPQGSRPECL